MKFPALLSLGYALAIAASCALPGYAQTTTSTQQVGNEHFSVRCDSSPNGKCLFELYIPECKEGPVKNGRPSQRCTYEYVTGFSLKVGETRILEDIPANVKNCAMPFGESAPDCSR